MTTEPISAGEDGRVANPLPEPRIGIFAPLGESTFRTIWLASMLSNIGQLIQGVGAAWEMTRLANSPDMVALVQSAMMLPLMLVALPSGAISDMFDRRKVAITGLLFASASAAALTYCASMGLITPWLLLGFTFLIGCGVALYGPAWQASIGEQVGPRNLPAAIALGSIGYNVARSLGPAIGGIIVTLVGAAFAFGINALSYLPLLVAFLFWRRRHAPSRLPPERIGRAIVSGVRYVFHSPPIRIVVTRTLIAGLAGAALSALMPLLARDQLAGNAGTYGLLLASYGGGSILGAFLMSRVRAMDPERATTICALVAGFTVVLASLSHSLPVTSLALAVSGASWMLLIAQFNVAVQLSAPRWVTARALALYTSAVTGGIAFGAWGWGRVAGEWGVGTALFASGIVICLMPLLRFPLPMPRVADSLAETVGAPNEPEVDLELTHRSGPVMIEIAYSVDPAHAREFYDVMQQLRRVRLRTGAFNWILSRDIADRRMWVEQYHLPTWGDYLRQRSRLSETDHESQAKAEAFHLGGVKRVTRRLERPLGSVRWRSDTPDYRDEAVAAFRP
jgi:MFS family permease